MNISLKRGNDRNLRVTVTNAAGQPVDITGWSVRFTVKKVQTMSDADAIINKLITSHENPTGGITNIPINGSDTDNQPIDLFYLDIRVRDALGKEHSSDTGTFQIIQPITDEV